MYLKQKRSVDTETRYGTKMLVVTEETTFDLDRVCKVQTWYLNILTAEVQIQHQKIV